ncbi:TIGR02147 family protein [Fibrobacter sp.]|uniref:TIGR02147 family protein n=1 Tax=Fibrobacter sp. TaxID=35828 RepID=UPI00388F4C68
MKPVLEYSSYRVYIRDYYAERKERSGFTWRDFANAAGYSSPVFLKLVCDGKANLSEAGIERVASAMGLVGADLQYFRLLVAFNQEKSSAAKKKYFAEMRKLANENSFAIVGEDQYDYYGSWLNPVLREMAPRLDGATPAQMAGELVFESAASSVKNSLKLLEKNGMLEKDEQGHYRQGNRSITTGNLDVTSLAIREMHRQMGELAVQSLDQVPVNERDVSGLTIGISENAFEKITKEIAEFRRRISAIVMDDSGEERVYRLNVQLFPLTNTLPKEESHV